MKKFMALLLALAMVLSMAACGGSSAPAATEAPKADAPAATEAPKADAPAASEYRVAMVTDYGDITDQSFNQTTWEAVIEFGEANGVEYKYYKPTTNDTAGRVASVELAIAEGYNVIVMPGYAFGGTIAEVSGQYPDIKFIALDVSAGDLLEGGVALKGESYDYNPSNWNLTDYVYMDNVYCAIYQEELSGYMAGYAAVKLGYTKLGFLGGMAVPAVVRFGYGYVQGVDAAAKELGITVDMNYAYGNQFSGDADITAVMDTWYQGGTEVVFACGGGIYTSAVEAANKYGAKVIGVDVDQSYIDECIVTSAMKQLQNVTETVLDALNNGDWATYGGKVSNFSLAEGEYVGLPTDADSWRLSTFTVDEYEALKAKLADGSVVVDNNSDDNVKPTVSDFTKVNYIG